jgi:hypothetical protein
MTKHTEAQDTTVTIKADCLRHSDCIVQRDGAKRWIGTKGLEHKDGKTTVNLVIDGLMDENATWEDRHDTYTIASDREVTVVENRTCNTCFGSGVYYGQGAVVNGVFKGFQGTCFRCEGKGYQNRADIMRCYIYDAKYRRV